MEYTIILLIIFSIIWIVNFINRTTELTNNANNQESNILTRKKSTKTRIEVPVEKKFVSFFIEVSVNFNNNYLRYFKGKAIRVGDGLGRENIVIRDQYNQYVGVIEMANQEYYMFYRYLKSRPNQSCFIWGFDDSAYSLPTMFVYINADAEDESILNKMVDNVIEYNKIYRKNFSEYTREEQIKIIELLYIIVYYCQKINLPEYYYPEIRRSELTTFSIILEKEKQFELLASLAQYAIVLDGGDPKRKNAFIKRTENAAIKMRAHHPPKN